MKLNSSDSISDLIALSYTEHREKIINFIQQRVNDRMDAENLTQDVWVRLLEYRKELTKATIVKLIYTIARNLVNDYLRHLYCVAEANDYIYETSECSTDYEESAIMARDLADFERRRVKELPTQRRTIYVWSRYLDKSVIDISKELSISRRTVENHLRLGRKEIREFMSKIG